MREPISIALFNMIFDFVTDTFRQKNNKWKHRKEISGCRAWHVEGPM